MGESDSMLPDPELGKATIAYETPAGEDDGNDVVRRTPRERMYYVERSVDEFRDRLESILDETKNRLGFD